MKRIIAILLAMAVIMVASADTWLVATLTHNDNITCYYGADAFKDAVNAAVDGDIINLSPGEFNGNLTIQKGITIIGAGYDAENVVDNSSIGKLKTTINDLIFINYIGEASPLIIEGININSYISTYACPNLYINKCISEFDCSGSSDSNISFNNSIIYDNDNNHNLNADLNLTFTNCIIRDISNEDPKSSIYYDHCIVLQINSNYPHNNYIKYGNFNNSFVMSLIDDSETYDHLTGSLAYNCIGYCPNNDLFASVEGENNRYMDNPANYFVSFDAENLEDNDYMLKDAVLSDCIGGDDTQIGIYGGFNPWNIVPNNPQIVKFEVGTKTNEDGTLNVAIEVNTED